MLHSFDYAVLRLVPQVDRAEFVNAGIVLFCLQKRFLDARIVVNEERWLALWPGLDVELARRHLEAFPRIAIGDTSAGPIARLSQRERFHWMVAPRSTIIQVSPVHTGLCHDCEPILEQLVQRLL
jgi:hypothetical protein